MHHKQGNKFINYILISFLFSLWDYYIGPMDPSGQPEYGLTHIGPMWNRVALPICVSYAGCPYVTHIGMFAGKLLYLKYLC